MGSPGKVFHGQIKGAAMQLSIATVTHSTLLRYMKVYEQFYRKQISVYLCTVKYYLPNITQITEKNNCFLLKFYFQHVILLKSFYHYFASRKEKLKWS